MTTPPMPPSWIPTTRDAVRHGRRVRMWTYKGHAMAYRGEDEAQWRAWIAEVWAAKCLIDAGETVAHASDDRHNPATRTVSVPTLASPHEEDA